MKKWAVGVLLASFVIYMLTGLRQVLPGERAVVRRFGKVIAHAGPGLWIGLPVGIDRVDRIQVDFVRRVHVGFLPDMADAEATPSGQLLTGDQNLVNLQVLLDYSVRAEEIEDYLVQAETVESVLTGAAEAVMTEWVGSRTVDEILIRGKRDLPSRLVEQTSRRIASLGLGIQIQGASVVHLLPPDEVKPAFDRVTSAQAEIQTQEQVARQEANRRLKEAQAESYRIARMAQAYAQEQLPLARAEADAFLRRLEQYRSSRQHNPHYLTGIWFEEIGKLFQQLRQNGRVDMLDHHLGPDGLDIHVAPQLPRKK